MSRQQILSSIFLFVLLLSIHINGFGQEKWKGYYSYKQCFQVVESKDFLVGATDLGLILYHKDTQSISVKNKINGLSDSGISTIKSLDDINTILIGYENGNIDIFRNGQIFNIPDLKIESMNTSKKINHFLYLDGFIYCSTDFGILKIDLEKNEIAATFIIGEEAAFIKVNSTLIDDDYIFAATASGIMRANINSTLAFYQNWEIISNDNEAYCDLEKASAGIIAVRGVKGGTVTLVQITGLDDEELQNFNNFESIYRNGEEYILTTRNQIHFLDASFSVTQSISSVETTENSEPYQPSFRDALSSQSGDLVFADWNGGLFNENGANIFQQILPPGPYSNKVFKASKIQDELWIVPGGFGSLYNNGNIPPVVSISKNDEWIVFNRDNTDLFTSQVRDLVNIAANPLNPDNVFVASWGNGLFEFDKTDNEGDIFIKNHFKEENSALSNAPNTPKDRYTRVWGLAFDHNANLYMTNSELIEGIVIYNVEDNAWHEYSYGIFDNLYNKIGEIIIDNNNFKWTYIIGEQGIVVFDDRGTVENQWDDRYRGGMSTSEDQDERNAGILKLWDENGESLTNNIYSLAKDENGYIWIGTDIGVLVQYDPANIFNTEKPAFIRIKVPRNDGSGLADYLLENQIVNAIAIDGANRKYFGTEGSGLYLISEDGTKTIDHFTTSNSPLPSDNIRNIEIDHESGEVYIATDAGLISYRGDATSGNSAFNEVYVYPNPVRPEYEGPVTISGLVDRTNVKITDTAGNLVYETISLGGKALWNGENLYGEQVKTGVYIVFLASPDGSQTAQTKIAFIR